MVLAKDFSFNTSAFFADINHQTNSSLSVLAIPFIVTFILTARKALSFRVQEHIAVRLYSS